LSGKNTSDSFIDMFVFETTQNIEQIEQLIIASSNSEVFSSDTINEIFRHMHTIKGSSAMMCFDDISSLTHSVEDLFFKIRENNNENYDLTKLSDLVLGVVDFVKVELEKIKETGTSDGKIEELSNEIAEFLKSLNSNDLQEQNNQSLAFSSIEISSECQEKGYNRTYEATVFFEDGCQMENIRAFGIIHKLGGIAVVNHHFPEELIECDNCAETIIKSGFKLFFTTDKSYDEMEKELNQTLFLRELSLKEIGTQEKSKKVNQEEEPEALFEKEKTSKQQENSSVVSIISVNVNKLDSLLNLAGEIVIAESMLTQNSDLKGLELPNFMKTAQLFRKIISELQDVIMSIRMVPLTVTFQKMNRIVHDMNKKLNKETKLVLVGEDTEVDKNIIEHLSDPLMHLVRNSIDHGIESKEERVAKGKPEYGTIVLEAINGGSEVIIIIKDDGKGFNKEKILKHAKEKGILTKPEEEMTDKEIYLLIFLPGFSTKENVTEFSGRGVGMDVVMQNIQAIGGNVNIQSEPDVGSTVTIKIPLTLSIISGMNIKVGDSLYTIPIKEIKESFRPKFSEIIIDPNGNEMILVRGSCCPIIRLHKIFKIPTDVNELSDGILVMVENDEKMACIFADELLGEQQMVVKALPKCAINHKGLSACTLLGDGSISIILDVGNII
jgi:two-component system chemotaxis sensor kinase CheA